ncbi:HEAT repeat domain-containing protein [Streptomyces rochei]|uniref:HEAT repeat domain-containing protein n=1 Tax=Streptomyces rochei TaxID=1928 RepID=UPI0036FE6CC2
MTGQAGREVGSDVTLGRFLQSQANMAGLSARDIAEHFQKLADQEKSRIANGAENSVDPVSNMSFSKSHLDRLYKDAASLPSKRFLKIFLEMTSRTAGIHPGQHRKLCRQAEELLITAHRNRHSRRAVDLPSSSHVPTGAIVATLQIQLELERAQRTEDRLRWALSDTQVLMGTLLQIISALRDIITELDTQVLQGLRASKGSNFQELTEQRRSQARSYKALAETQFDRVNQRRRLLEVLWDQAHGTLHRLSLHAEATNIPSLPDGLALQPRQLLPDDFLSQPALVDIAEALGKVQQLNDTEEQTALELQHMVTAAAPLQPNDELAILVAATRVSDSKTRVTALRTLLNDWPRHPDTRDTLVRLAHDTESAIQLTTASSLADNWVGDAAARDALVDLARHRDAQIRETAALGLAEGWAGDTAARDALVDLARHRDAQIRETAALGLAEGWAGDTAARDALLALIHDDDVYVRMTVTESLIEKWLGDQIARTALHILSRDTSPTVRWAARQAIAGSDDLGSSSPQEAARSMSLLLAMRLPADISEYEGYEPLPLLGRLRRGIAFDTGITVLLGGNGAGKTVLLNALALLAPRVFTDVPLTHVGALSRQLAEYLEVAWNDQITLEEIHYLSGLQMNLRGYNKKLSAMENWKKQWVSYVRENSKPNCLFLFDEPTVYLDHAAQNLMLEQLTELVNQGCQVIVATARDTWIEVPSVRVIRIDKRIRRKLR